MTIHLDVEGHTVPFRLDCKSGRWHSLEELEEGAFPLIAVVQGKRFELYSDGTFAVVDQAGGP